MDRRLFYLNGANHQQALLVCQTKPVQAQYTLVVIPPLLEEMNACRRHLAEFAAQAVHRSISTIYFDLLGTGDSQQSLTDVHSLAVWQDNITAILGSIETPIILLAVRSGALLLTDEQLASQQVLFWQPELSGKRWLKSIRRAARLQGNSEPEEQQASRYLGYSVSNQLQNEIEAVELTSSVNAHHCCLYLNNLAPANLPFPILTAQGLMFWQHSEASKEAMQPWFDTSFSALNDLQASISNSTTKYSHTNLSQPAPLRSINTNSGMESCVSLQSPEGTVFAVHHQAHDDHTTVIFLPGRPQTRVGPHRLFVSLARQLSSAGISSVRFDYCGWGDSVGTAQDYQSAAHELTVVVAWLRAKPNATKIVLLGLCDGATMALLASQPCCHGQILLNPFFDSDAAWSGALIEDHYLAQATDSAAVLRHLKQPLKLPAKISGFVKHWWNSKSSSSSTPSALAINQLKSSCVPTLVCWSAEDLTAKQSQLQLQEWLNKPQQTVKLETIKQADHTFSNSSSQHQLFTRILKFLNTI
ncbi:hypothetical protein GCM10011369_27690 [Neiella marina]|uniref:AB hydrolase-1 domain-containing protein n=1 Tax=Neiella marina TaxID=508461 RepID=A0A8J2XQB5_9GAMM|nr:alpha/beta fold hydrolase [Neiella marina]GGA84142.1 hypothetical protein GCM10011369_27690 [Neiella marina]